MSADRLHPGDRVALRPPSDILATLDGGGALEGTLFMPEMLASFGRVFTVAKRVEKVCDTICPVGSRRMQGVVFLENQRCDGAGHGGCQAACRLYWKESWLALMAPNALPPRPPGEAAVAKLRELAAANARNRQDAGLFRCQATEMRRASTPLSVWDVRQYVREAQSGNVSWGTMLRITLLRALAWELLAKARRPAGMLPRPRHVNVAAWARPGRLDLQPGDWVEVRSAAEIAATLDAKNMNKGLYFSAPEMATECGKQFQVRRRISRIIEESTGRMLTFKNDCIELEGPLCRGDRSHGRWFCAREIYPYWREAWLKRVAAPPAAETSLVERVGVNA